MIKLTAMIEVNRIESRDNARLVRARKIRDGREKDRVFIEGRRLVEEAAGSSLAIEEAYVAENFGDRELVERLARKGIEIYHLPEHLFRSIAATEHPQGIAVIARRPVHTITDLEVPEGSIPLFIFLKEINNPANLGAVMRAAEAAGAAAIFISRRSADAYSPKSLRAAMGSAFRLNIVEEADLSSILSMARERGVRSLAVDNAGGGSYLDVDWRQPHLLMFGSEAHGLTEEDKMQVTEHISIPMAGTVESLNLAVAVGVVLFEARRRFYM